MKSYEEAILVALDDYVDYRVSCHQLSNAKRNKNERDIEYWEEWKSRDGDSTRAQQRLIASIYDVPEDQVLEDLRTAYLHGAQAA